VCQVSCGSMLKCFNVLAAEFEPRESLMSDARSGSQAPAAKLVELFYPELRRLAQARMAGERIDHTWQPTVLVNELYLELTRAKSLPVLSTDDDKQAFLGLAAFMMRRLLVHHARPLRKRITKTELSEAVLSDTGEQTLYEIEDLLIRLGAIDPQLRLVVEMKVFEGLTREEIAERLGCSVRTIARHWEFAQHWLQRAMGSHDSKTGG
jgi:RNA polymerase sigma-70 factor (ECF subfamily)